MFVSSIKYIAFLSVPFDVHDKDTWMLTFYDIDMAYLNVYILLRYWYGKESSANGLAQFISKLYQEGHLQHNISTPQGLITMSFKHF